MSEIQNLDFGNMAPGQEKAVSELALKSAKGSKGFTPEGWASFERYVSPEALRQRAGMGFRCELAWLSDRLAAMIETRGPDRISMLYVHPDHASSGLGSRLVARAAARCAEAGEKIKYLNVYATDDAVAFYERAGFVRSGLRRELNGIFSTPYRLPLTAKGKTLPGRLHAASVDFFVFSGTGNSLLAAQTVAEALREGGVTVRLREMTAALLGKESALGLAFPVACFSTYPSVWRFVDALPPGEGREVFALLTCGGAPMGAKGPLGRALRGKGYRTVGVKSLVMPGNYNNKTLPEAKNAARVTKALSEARAFAGGLLSGRVEWGGGIPLFSAFMDRLARTRRPWNAFYTVFPLAVDEEKCLRCGRCSELCPAGAVTAKGSFPLIDPKLCESCQRCAAFCPAGAIGVPAKPAVPYRAMSYEAFKTAFK
ncbi:MAG: EFR1 family ferrodoxin [Synergistaceae bacterium]|jgi:ferredoxin/GNAT superfamily N-acetyltransferase|nr:EFR1 family ferrodoxin [Synergistaceae bacterium]